MLYNLRFLSSILRRGGLDGLGPVCTTGVAAAKEKKGFVHVVAATYERIAK